ncbi:MAG: hypothetical protein KA734_09560 [Fluviicola sp.]|nr:hypothetical protein [Fluviicola sp.]
MFRNQTNSLSESPHQIGKKGYELSNHLNNVLSVISDKVIPHSNGSTVDYWQADILQSTDYSPFGVQLNNRTLSKSGVTDFTRFGFQNQEEDPETGLVNYKYRMHDPRLGRFFAIDPLAGSFPWNSSYAFSENKVTHCIELEGLESVEHHFYNNIGSETPVLTSPSQWLIRINTTTDFDYYRPPSEINWNSFNKANKYNTKNQNASLYTSVSERSAYYGWAQSQLTDNTGKYWFKAAQIVTSWNGVGAAENTNLGYLTDDAENLILAGNRYLFSYNMFNAKNLTKNGKLDRTFIDARGDEKSFKGLVGRDLDYMLVEYEQTRVQEFLDLYQKNHPDFKMNSAIGSINWSFDSFMADENVKTVLNNFFMDDNGESTFNFGSYEDRVKLGKELINLLRKKDEKK